MSTETTRDWTSGPAKFAAAVVLGGAAVVGMVWSASTRLPASARAGAALGAGSPAPATDATPTRAAAPARIDRLINLNTASAAELELLPGIGPAMAERIIEHRESRGPFRSINELDRIGGIGARTIERLRDKVTVE
ncbi:MAG: ComEA family DNA-binding protein [Phycisphaeraceae bacterium]|nr:ComEA family DNA-binding protein [Phycisphaeraceae bacterium]MBX3408195.1 ComEA family DNA-binding protein [Phycisphaeraceae bacterium]